MPLQQIIRLITAKKDSFLEYEALTQKLLDCPVEEIEALVAARAGLVERIDGLNAEIGQIVAQIEPSYPMLGAAIKNSCAYGSLEAALQEVFTRSQEVYGVINRIQNLDPLAVSRMESLKQEMLEQIAAANTNKDANLQRYLSNTALKDHNFSVFGDKYAKV